MQKNVLWSGFRAFPNRTYIENYDYLTKIIKVMRITTFFLIAFCVHVSATGLSQTVTLQGNNLPLQEVLSVIKQQTGFAVVYTEESVESKRVAVVRANKTPLLQFLDLVLPTQSLDYEIKNKTIVIIPRIREESKTVDPTRRNPVAQSQSTITGRLQDRAGTPISGATITVKGTVRKTASDERGQFRLVVQPGETLVLTSLGFLAKEILVGDIVQLGNITLEISTSNLDEVSVVAYGTTTRRETIGSISAIKGEELAGIPSSNLANLLQGRVAGMDVTNMSGSPGGGGIGVTIRGFNSLGVEQQRRFSDPLWVVDGVPLNSFTSPVTGTNFLSDINTDMIESVQVLKDASAASLYGSRAANGVIMVTTKKGQKNQAVQFSINFSQSYNVLPKLPTVTLGKAERDYRLAALKNWNLAYYDQASMRYVYPSTLSEYYLNPYSRIDYFFVDQPSTDNGNFLQDSLNSFFNNATNFFPIYTQTGKITNGNIQGYGGSSNMNYGIGLGYYSEKGVYVETGFDRIDLNSSIGIVPSPKLSVDLRLNAAVTSRKRGEPSADLGPAPTIEAVPGDPFRLSTLLPGDGSVVWDNVLEKLKGTRENNRSARLRSNFTMTYEILNGLNISTSGALDYAVHRRNYFLPSYLDESGYSNSVGLTGVNLLALNENLLSYTKTVSGGHNIKFISGFSYQYDREDSNSGSGRNSPSDKIYYVQPGFPIIGERGDDEYSEIIAFQRYRSDMQEKALLSYFARGEYNYHQKYLFSASFRRDGSSVFGANNKWGTFPSLALGWAFSEESFVKQHIGWFDLGKLRASWGRSGMNFSQNYLALGIMKAGEPYQGNGVLTPEFHRGLYNDELSWEETDQYDFGLDIDLFHSRFSFTADYYYRYTDKMLMHMPLPGTHNGYREQWRNAAAVSNEGIELLASFKILQRQNIYWKVSVNGARNWNRFEKSYDDRDVSNTWIIGKPLAGMYALRTEGFIQSQSDLPIFFSPTGRSNFLSAAGYPLAPYREGDYRFVDFNGDGLIAPYNDAVYFASALPTISGGILQEVRWRNFDCNLLFSFQLGRHIVNQMPLLSLATTEAEISKPFLLNIDKTVFWSDLGDRDADYPRIQYDNFNWTYFNLIDRYVERVNWLKMKTFTLGYELPVSLSKRFGWSGLRIFYSGENLFTFSSYSGLDPETVPIDTGMDDGKSYPLARKMTLGLTLKF